MVKRTIFAGADVLAGSPELIARLAEYPSVGLVTNPTGILRSGMPLYEALAGRISLTALFSPEHGVRGDRQAGAEVEEYTDETTGLTVWSVYGPGRAWAEEAMASLGCLLFGV